MPVADLIAELEKFMVPVGPQGHEDPLLGWPDKGHTPPPTVQGVSLSGSSGNTVLVGSGFSPGALAGGTASISNTATSPSVLPPPPMLAEGVSIVSNTATEVVLSSPISDGAGVHTVVVGATTDDQVLFNLGTTNISLIMSVRRISPSTDGAVDPTVTGHNLATGMVGIGEMTSGILVGQQIEFTFRRAGGPVPSGKAYVLTPPRPPPGMAFTVGKAWSEAYGVYFGAGSPAPVPGSYGAAIAAMKDVMDNLSGVPAMGPVSFTAGILAFWGVVSAQAATIWPSLPALSAVPPPPVFGVGPLILAAMTATAAVPVNPPPGPNWTDVRSKADVAVLAGAVAAANIGALIISQPGPSPVPVPFVLA